MTRAPAHDLAAEQAVIGAVLIAPPVIAELAGLLTPADFYRPAHTAVGSTVWTPRERVAH